MTKEMLIKNIQLNYPHVDMKEVQKLIEAGEKREYSYEGIYLLFKAYYDLDGYVLIKDIQDAFNISDERMQKTIETIEEKYGIQVVEECQNEFFVIDSDELE